MAANKSAAVYDEKSVYGYVQFADEADFKLKIFGDKDNKSPVAVSVNFVTYAIPRNVEVMVKAPIIEALTNAMTFGVELDETTGHMTSVEENTYKFTASKV